MKPSKIYMETRESTSQWLLDNAPNYVLSNVAELRTALKAEQQKTADLEKNLQEYFDSIQEIIDDAKPGKWWQFWK